jgi:multidrug efflux pump subunit AcrB
LNYAQIIIQVNDKHDTGHLVGPLQEALSARIAGARIDVRQLESGKAVGLPVAIRISGEDIPTLRALAERVKAAFRSVPQAARVRDDWGDESFTVKLQIDPDRANLAGLSNLDVAASSTAGMNGLEVTTLREGDKQIPVVIRMRMEERAQLGDIRNLYVYSSQGTSKVPLQQVSSIAYNAEAEKLRRQNQFRTITISCLPEEGLLPSEVMKAARPRLAEIAGSLPPGYRFEIGGEEEDQVAGFKELAMVMAISIGMIFLALEARHQAFHSLRGDPLRDGRGDRRVVDYGRTFRLHGFPGGSEPRRSYRQPHHSPVRLHRRKACRGRATERSAA